MTSFTTRCEKRNTFELQTVIRDCNWVVMMLKQRNINIKEQNSYKFRLV